MMKKALSILLAAALCISLAACGVSSGTSTSSGASQATAPETAQASSSPGGATGADYGEYSPDNPLTLKLSHFANEQNQLHKLAALFKEKVEAATGGAVEVVIYTGGVLGNDRESLDSVIAGTLEMAVNNTPIMSKYIDVFQVLDLAYLFEDYDHIYAFLESDIARELMDSMSGVGARFLGMQAVGWRNFDLCTGSVKTPEDLKGLKIRVTDSPIYMADYTAWGANPLIIAGSEVLTALQQGTIDGCDNVNNVQWAENYTEFAKYITISEHAVHFNGLTINNALFESLTPDLQEAISTAAVEAGVERSKALEQENQDLVQVMIDDQGAEISYDIDKQAFKDALTGVYDDFRANHAGAKYLDEILALAK